MSGYSNENPLFWNSHTYKPTGSLYGDDYNQFQNETLDFKTHEEYEQDLSRPYDPLSVVKTVEQGDDEPPLLEELEIYPDRIFQKVLAVLNPFRSHSLTDDADYLTKEADLAGPISFYLILAICLFLSGSNKAHFGYIYGISVASCILMFCLLSLMTTRSGVFSLINVASILGYSLIPIVGLSVFGVLVSLKGFIGVCSSVLAIIWSSVSASRLFVAVSEDKEQQLLIAYPCALVAALYVLLIVF